ncbi:MULTISPECIES: cbb3-type cytochrome c oxidase subunit 3 [unclassified Meridianimarinicoccus]|uniref:cbb3-type cytochrome c oxidase subunit 3 n=1 Tax=unclassified Meridianimarinicoccus TaxID=2923344 RepID=UPI001865FA3F|nr:cbb3-type cytochrome c oxidase subunit 3 [Fluviibacterium sp. MJW13]
METYTLLRQFADSWMMLFIFAFFIGVVIYVIFGNRQKYRDTADVIFRHEDKPLSDEDKDR